MVHGSFIVRNDSIFQFVLFEGGRTVCLASSEASKLLDDGRKKWDAGDRMGALNLWESALKLNPTIEQRLVALYNATAVHASFGDIELAQITLRDAVQNGLDFQKVLEDPESIDPSMVQLKASQQVLIRLKRFAQATEKASKSASQPPMSSGVKSKVSSGVLRSDLSEILETDMQGIDTSALGILKRVVLVILALSALGVGLWFFGLKYLSPLE